MVKIGLGINMLNNDHVKINEDESKKGIKVISEARKIGILMRTMKL